MRSWLAANEVLLSVLGAFSAATLCLSLAIVPLLIIRIPANYFVAPDPTPLSFRARHPLIRYAVLIAKNLLGAILFLSGMFMLLLPGQGLLTMMVGLMLMSFPGKRQLEVKLISRRPMQQLFNWVRFKAGRAPLELPTVSARQAETSN